MASMVDLMLDQAVALVEQNPRSGAAKRRAVSSAYYAAFHALMWLCASEMLPGGDTSSADFERVYRGIDHGPMKNAFQTNGPLKQTIVLRDIGTDLIQLQEARMIADYSPPRSNLFELAAVKEHLDRARSVVSRLEGLTGPDRQTLAVHLLFQARRK
ncbi:hypothetical protein IPV08_02610 [Methylobacterium sp. SD274]|uniref:hypothetical protein n=1 Tax=Methylobacterium sp. SD274 TaxID=2782009 RepID=UPI001A969A48|nr:hypothetical protein [Methylobacterium sp. SD274]MBO1018861.1 hypothetical protein [Methylobacterium sp. SD274]